MRLTSRFLFSKCILLMSRQLVTNHVLQFLAIDRSDPKKFQVLQIIANLLSWDEGGFVFVGV